MAQHWHFVYTICLNHVSQATEAEDLTQEVFVHGSHDLAQLREPAQVLRGVRQVARKCPHTGAIATPCRHTSISRPVLHVACEQRCLGRTLCWQQVEDAHHRHNAPFVGVLLYRVLITGPDVPLLDRERFAILRHF
jgi:hypothetical protein